jgi:hypothetical protein
LFVHHLICDKNREDHTKNREKTQRLIYKTTHRLYNILIMTSESENGTPQFVDEVSDSNIFPESFTSSLGDTIREVLQKHGRLPSDTQGADGSRDMRPVFRWLGQ